MFCSPLVAESVVRAVLLRKIATGYFISGRVIKAMSNNWHPDCFRCQSCGSCLADRGFVKLHGR